MDKSAFATALHPLLTGSIASDKGPASGVGDDPGGGGSGGSTITGAIISGNSDNISNTHPSTSLRRAVTTRARATTTAH